MDNRKIKIGKIFELDHNAEDILSELSAHEEKFKIANDLLHSENQLYQSIIEKNKDNIDLLENAVKDKPFPYALLFHIFKKIPDSFDDTAQALREPFQQWIPNVFHFKGGLSELLGGAGALVYALELHSTYQELKEISAERKKINDGLKKSGRDEKTKEEIEEEQYLIAKRNHLLTSYVMNYVYFVICSLGFITALTLIAFGILFFLIAEFTVIAAALSASLATILAAVTLLGTLAAGFLTAKYFLTLLPNADALHLARTAEEKPRNDLADEFRNNPEEAFEYVDLLERVNILNKIRKEINEYKKNARDKVSDVLKKMNRTKERGRGNLTDEEKELYNNYYLEMSSESYVETITKKYGSTYSDIKNENHLFSYMKNTKNQIEQFKDKNFQNKMNKYHERRVEKLEAEHKFAFNFTEFSGSLMTLIGIVTLNVPLIYAGISIGLGSKIFQFVDSRTNGRPTKYFRKKFADIGLGIADYFWPNRNTVDNAELVMPVPVSVPILRKAAVTLDDDITSEKDWDDDNDDSYTTTSRIHTSLGSIPTPTTSAPILPAGQAGGPKQAGFYAISNDSTIDLEPEKEKQINHHNQINTLAL